MNCLMRVYTLNSTAAQQLKMMSSCLRNLGLNTLKPYQRKRYRRYSGGGRRSNMPTYLRYDTKATGVATKRAFTDLADAVVNEDLFGREGQVPLMNPKPTQAHNYHTYQHHTHTITTLTTVYESVLLLCLLYKGCRLRGI